MPEIKVRELKIVRVKNGYMTIPDMGQYSVFAPTETQVAETIPGLVVLVVAWATLQEVTDAMSKERDEGAPNIGEHPLRGAPPREWCVPAGSEKSNA